MRGATLTGAFALLLVLVLLHPFAGVLLWNWVSFMNPHRLVWGPAGEWPWAAIIFAATLLGCALGNELRLPPRNATTLLLVALMGCFTATSLVALGNPAEVWDKWEHTIKVMLGLLLTASMLTTRRRIHALIWVMAISLCYFGVRGGVFAILNGGNYRVWGPPQTMITDNNHLAAAMLIALPLVNYLRMQSAHALVRAGLAVAMGLTLLATIASYSRGALLGLAAVTLIFWWRSQRKVLSAIVLAASLAGAITFMPGGWTDRMESITAYQEDASASERLVLWGISWKLALDRPLVGAGFTGPYSRAVVDRVEPGGPARAVHSIWFELLGEQGFPTFILWAALSFVGLWQAVRIAALTRGRADLAWAHDLGRMAQASIVAYLVAGSFLSLSYWDYYWTLLVVVAATQSLVLRALAGEGAPRKTLAPMAATAAPQPASPQHAGWRARATR
jgi:probable O-glycosylation ligase (exosortase A-associated)